MQTRVALDDFPLGVHFSLSLFLFGRLHTIVTVVPLSRAVVHLENAFDVMVVSMSVSCESVVVFDDRHGEGFMMRGNKGTFDKCSVVPDMNTQKTPTRYHLRKLCSFMDEKCT